MNTSEIAKQLRLLADQLDPPHTDPPETTAILLQRAGIREPHLSRLSSLSLDYVLAWISYVVDTNYPADHRPGYLIRRLDAGAWPPSHRAPVSFETILPNRPVGR